MKLKVVLRAEPVGGYTVSVPALPGSYSEGETREEALANNHEAAELLPEGAITESLVGGVPSLSVAVNVTIPIFLGRRISLDAKKRHSPCLAEQGL